MNGRDDTTAFLPLDFRIGGQNKDSYPMVGQYLTRDQTRYILYKKVETGEMINMDTIQQEIEQEKQLNRIDDDNGEINLYRELVVNNAERTEPLMTQMEQWSILSNILNHINKLEDLLKALLKNGLKMSPKKCQLFKTSLQYMGNEIFIDNKKVCVKPLRNRLEAIQKITTT